jgi:hypothetical protein
MGEIAEDMLTGVLCAGCGTALDCKGCIEMEIPMYCDLDCAKDHGAEKEQVCNHEKYE